MHVFVEKAVNQRSNGSLGWIHWQHLLLRQDNTPRPFIAKTPFKFPLEIVRWCDVDQDLPNLEKSSYCNQI
jgi:hypothetical protein